MLPASAPPPFGNPPSFSAWLPAFRFLSYRAASYQTEPPKCSLILE